MQNKFKIFFSIIGLLSLVKIIHNYGLNVIQEEIQRSGFLLILLALTFIPTLLCYAISWLLATEHRKMSGKLSFLQKIILFAKFTTASIAWNNLTPFLKVGGEPLKYMMLSKYLSKRNAISSTTNYNIIHLLSTALSFIIGAFALAIFYDLPVTVKYAAWGFISFIIIVLYLSYKIVRARSSVLKKFYKWQSFRLAVVNMKIIRRSLTAFYKRHPQTFFLSIFFDTIARFIEGLTFYFGFLLIKHPISILSAAFLDVARTLVDTIFFFIPYQVGTREEGVRFFMEKVLIINPSGFLTAVLFYRFVELVWILIGYFIWVSIGKSRTDAKV